MPGKLPLWRLSDIRERCSDPRGRPGKAALRLYRTCAQCCAPMQHILRKALLFECTRACCLRPLAHGCIVVEVLCRKLPQLFCFSLGQHCRQKLSWQQREGTSERSTRWHYSEPPFAPFSSPNFSNGLPKAIILQFVQELIDLDQR